MSGFLEIHCTCGETFIAYESSPSIEPPEPGDLDPAECPYCGALIDSSMECEPVSPADLEPDPYDAANDR